jgi:hypothetical protein
MNVKIDSRREQKRKAINPLLPHSTPDSTSAPTPFIQSFGQELLNFCSCLEVHHRLIIPIHGQLLSDLHMLASACFLACHLSHRIPEGFLLVCPLTAMPKLVLLHLAHFPCTSPAFNILLVAERY